jgi:hypothetical protein
MEVPDPRTVTSMPDFLLGVGWAYRIIHIITTDLIPGQLMVQIEVHQGSILEATCEAIVNAANSQGGWGQWALADRRVTP